jgi:hypothetical protein
MAQSARHTLAAFRRGAATDSLMIQVLPNTRFAVQVACALRLYQPVLIRGSLETVDNVLDESEFVDAIGGPQTPMLMNASAWRMSNMMLTAMIRDASETSCASSYYSRVRRPAASGKRERQQSLINFRFGAPAPRSGLDRSSAGAYKGVVPPGGAGWICGPVTTWGWPGASVRPVYPPLEYLGDHDCGQADPAGTCQGQAPVAGNQAVSGLPAMKGEAADVNRRQ